MTVEDVVVEWITSATTWMKIATEQITQIKERLISMQVYDAATFIWLCGLTVGLLYVVYKIRKKKK
jgi:hypothetical protein